MISLLLPATASAAIAPTTIRSPLVDTSNSTDGFVVHLAKSLICPDGATLAPLGVTFADPSGHTTDTVSSCAGMWIPATDASPSPTFMAIPTPAGDDPLADYGMDTNRNDPFFGPTDAYRPDPLGPSVVPFSWAVNGAAGVIARGAVTAEIQPGQTIEQGTDSFINICIDQGYALHSANGRLNCYVGSRTTFTQGWPSAPRRAHTTVRVFAQKIGDGCRLATGMTVLPNLNNLAWRRVRLEVRGRSRHGKGYDVVRYVTFNTTSGYEFGPLRSGRYLVSASYPGDPERFPGGPAVTAVVLPARCG